MAKTAKKSEESEQKPRRRPIQQQIPGTEDKKDPKLVELAQNYREARDYRKELTAKEITAHDALKSYMVENEIETYRDVERDLIIFIEHGKTKVRVRTLQQEHDENEEADAA